MTDFEAAGLLSIPQELRDRVYELLLVSDKCIDISNFSDRGKVLPQNVSLWPAVLSTCRQIHREAIGFLYRRNTFYITIPMHVHHALRRAEVTRALRSAAIPVAAEDDPPEPETWASTLRMAYIHPGLSRVTRLIIEISQDVPKAPHWQEGDIRVDHTMTDLCNALEQTSNLACLVLRSHGCAPQEAWVDAAGGDRQFARGLETLMWQYHEWHFERAWLAARRCGAMLWLNSNPLDDRIILDGSATFWQSIRSVEHDDRCTTRTVPLQISRCRQLSQILLSGPLDRS